MVIGCKRVSKGVSSKTRLRGKWKRGKTVNLHIRGALGGKGGMVQKKTRPDFWNVCKCIRLKGNWNILRTVSKKKTKRGKLSTSRKRKGQVWDPVSSCERIILPMRRWQSREIGYKKNEGQMGLQ